MNPNQPDKAIDNIVTTLFHSYDARGNQLAIDEAKAKLKALLVEARIDTHKGYEQLFIGLEEHAIIPKYAELARQFKEHSQKAIVELNNQKERK